MVNKHIHKIFYLSIFLIIIGAISFINIFLYNFWSDSVNKDWEVALTFIFLGVGFTLNFITFIIGGIQSYRRQHISIWWGFNLATSVAICIALIF